MHDAFITAITDIRKKTVEEPWYGRATKESAQDHEHTASDSHAASGEHAPSTPDKTEVAEKETLSAADETRALFKSMLDKYPSQNTPEPEQDIEHERER